MCLSIIYAGGGGRGWRPPDSILSYAWWGFSKPGGVPSLSWRPGRAYPGAVPRASPAPGAATGSGGGVRGARAGGVPRCAHPQGRRLPPRAAPGGDQGAGGCHSLRAAREGDSQAQWRPAQCAYGAERREAAAPSLTRSHRVRVRVYGLWWPVACGSGRRPQTHARGRRARRQREEQLAQHAAQRTIAAAQRGSHDRRRAQVRRPCALVSSS
jgi:hypothetical protein